jgi:catechol 2,3-dioxygenase-like lactoylglutathione lyase family enzyme
MLAVRASTIGGIHMAKLRHIAITVDDMEKTAQFYERAFDMKRVRQSDVAIMLSDGVMSLAIIHSQNENAEGRKGLHHIGFLVDDMEQGAARVEESGAVYHGQIKGIGNGPQEERKYRGPDGIHFDVATKAHAKRVWCIPAE